MMILAFLICGQFTIEKVARNPFTVERVPAFTIEQTAALPAGPSHDAIPQATDGRIEQRRAAYARILREVERTGSEAVYESQGPADQGWMLPKGKYRIVRDKDGDAAYEEIVPAVKSKPKGRPIRWNEVAVPIPEPDPSLLESPDPLIVFPRASIGAADCVGDA